MYFNEINISECFPLLVFENQEEEKLFLQNLKSKGIFLYKQVYDALCNWQTNCSIKYEHFKNLIRYDKSIRDKLYKYLCVAEEHLRNIIFEELETLEKFEDNENKKLDIDALQNKDKSNLNSNLYEYSYSRFFDFGTIEKIFEKYDLAIKYSIDQNDIVMVRKKLRNKVMHHNMLLLSYHTDKSKIEREIKEIEDGVEALYRLMPTEVFKEGSIQNGKLVGGLTQDINKSNFKDGDINQPPYENLICLHKFKDGRFNR
ncbi:MAG: hypothetical protein K2M08_00050 [Anaeroplasmataceae bacterium]|nr:hypothetical protein [Anaeroplasmataceae bacterium]